MLYADDLVLISEGLKNKLKNRRSLLRAGTWKLTLGNGKLWSVEELQRMACLKCLLMLGLEILV